MKEDNKGFAITLVLFNLLILSIGYSVFWLIQIVFSQSFQIMKLMKDFGI